MDFNKNWPRNYIYILFQSIPMGERVSIQNKTEHVEALKGTPSFFQPGFQSHSQNQNLLVFSIWDLPPQQYTSAQTAAALSAFTKSFIGFPCRSMSELELSLPEQSDTGHGLKRDVSLQANHLWNKMFAKTLGYSELLLRLNSETLSQWQ